MRYRGPKGTYDVYPGGREAHERPDLWRVAEDAARDAFRRYNFAEVRTPIFEDAQLYIRGVGEGSDIVRKEMFLFEDRGGSSLALRPEGTAGVVRSYIENNLYKLAQPLKLFYIGPMFRYERQQKGRYRQHTQVGAEILGSTDPLVDVEAIALLYDFHQSVGVREEVVHINTLGDFETRKAYVPELRAFLEKHRKGLDPDSVSRLETNPLRILDSKDRDTQSLLAEAPKVDEYLSREALDHFSAVKSGLETLNVPYSVDERLVRGLDYYTSTVFEAKSSALGAQDTVGAGGRYNGLVQELGGPDLPGIGFGSGIERVLLAAAGRENSSALDVFFVTLEPEARPVAMRLAGALRAAGLACDLDYGGRGMKGQFKQADRMGASWTVVIGSDELRDDVCTLRDMTSGEEKKIPVSDGPKELLRAIGA